MEKILVSACLLGENCKYSGGNNYNQKLVDMLEARKEELEAVPVCPEVLGGLATPRTPAEIRGELVVTAAGHDVTAAYKQGAGETLRLARECGCRRAVLKERSPSCGSGEIYDGTFSHTVISGDGMTAALLKQNGILVIGESEL